MSMEKKIINIIKNAESMKTQLLAFDDLSLEDYTGDNYNCYMKRKIVFLKQGMYNVKSWLRSIDFEVVSLNDEDSKRVRASVLRDSLTKLIQNKTVSPEEALAFEVEAMLFYISLNFEYFLFISKKVDAKFNSKYFESAQLEFNAFASEVNKIVKTIIKED